MIENVIGKFALPMGVAINFVINGKDADNPHGHGGTSQVSGGLLQRGKDGKTLGGIQSFFVG